MSMNLHCKEIALWQTPTWVTHIALYNSKGNKRKVKETEHIYIEWCRQTANRTYKDREEVDNYCEVLDNHIKEVRQANIKKFYEL